MSNALTEQEPLLSKYGTYPWNNQAYSTVASCSDVHLRAEKMGYFENRRMKRHRDKYYNELKELQNFYDCDRDLVNSEEKETFDSNRNLIDDMGIVKEHKFDTDRLLARVTFTLNIVLLFVNMFASITTGSLAIVNTFVDSCVDITTSLVLSICLWLINNTSYQKYPRGRERLELLGVILCSIILVVSNTFLILQSITAIVTGQIEPDVNATIISVMLAGSVLKTTLMIVCYRRNSESSKVLAMDMRNDVATTLVAVVCATIGSLYWPYADPVGGIIVCGIIAVSWLHYATKRVPKIVGVQAEKQHVCRILNIVIEHDVRISRINHLMVYHTGMQATVELDVAMDENLPSKETREISRSLRNKLMKLDFVERVFIDCDVDKC